jgi:hypothetical protein
MLPVRILSGGMDITDRCKSDDYIGTAMLRLDVQAATQQVLRARMVSSNGKNDWTAVIRLALR